MSLCMNRSITIPFLSNPPTNDLKHLSKTNTKKNKETSQENLLPRFSWCPCWMGKDNDPLVPSFFLAPFKTKWWRKNDVQAWLGDYPIMFEHIYMCVYKFTDLQINRYTYLHVYIYAYTQDYIYANLYRHTCTYKYFYSQISLALHVCIHLCTYINTFRYTCWKIHMYMYIQT